MLQEETIYCKKGEMRAPKTPETGCDEEQEKTQTGLMWMATRRRGRGRHGEKNEKAMKQTVTGES